MFKLRLLLPLLALLLGLPASVRAQSYTWQALPAAPGNGQKQDDVFFVDAAQGWAVNGSGQISRTQDGGQTWTRQLTQSGTYFRCIGFVDTQRGFAGNIGPNYFPGVTDANPLYRTLDGGATWQPVTGISGPAATGLCAIEVVSAEVIYAAGRVGGPSHLLKSTDGGQTWISRAFDPAQIQMVTDIKFLSPTEGYAFGGSSPNVQLSRAVVLRTTDGGQTWAPMYRSARPFELVWKASFPTPQVGYLTVLSYAPNVLARYVAKTTDGGLTWQELPFVDNGCKEFGIGFLDANTGWVGTDVGTGYETRDGGQSWQPSTLGRVINKVRLVRGPGTQVTGYAIGLNLTKLQTTALATTPVVAAAPKLALQAYPNPTARRVTLRYTLPAHQAVRLLLTDTQGRLLATVRQEVQAAGPHELEYALPPSLSHNLVHFVLVTAHGRSALPVSVQP